MDRPKLIWTEKLPLDDAHIAQVPATEIGKLIISASGITDKPQDDVRIVEGNIRAEIRAYQDDAKRKPPLFPHGILTQFRWAAIPKTE
jgi:hypothetical protein